jgi:hypothetical protein
MDCVSARITAARAPRGAAAAVTPIHDAHVCTPPATADLIGREMDFECACGRRWRLEHYWSEGGEMLGPAWILALAFGRYGPHPPQCSAGSP